MNWETQKDYIKYKIQFWLTIFIILFLVSISLSAQVSEPPTILSYGMVRCKFRFFSSERPTLERPSKIYKVRRKFLRYKDLAKPNVKRAYVGNSGSEIPKL